MIWDVDIVVYDLLAVTAILIFCIWAIHIADTWYYPRNGVHIWEVGPRAKKE